MEILQAIKTRRSVRQFLDVPVEWEKVGIVLEAGRLAPSAGNTQEWSFIVVTEEGARKEIAECCVDGIWMATAPIHIVIVANTEQIARNYGLRGERLYSIQDCAVAASQMMLAAVSQGLGTCWVGAFDEHALRRLLSIPDSIRPQLILTLGYPDEQPRMPPRKPLENIVFLNSYGNRIKDIGMVLRDYDLLGRAFDAGKEVVSHITKPKRMKIKIPRTGLREKLRNKLKKE